jgi:mxaJ protein
MFSRSLEFALMFVFAAAPAIASTPLRICADPDNLPFSNRAGGGFDNRIAVLIARDLHREPVFIWTRQRRGFLREQFNRNVCDVLPGIPTGTTRGIAVSDPYYTSSYAFVTPAHKHLQIASFSDPRLTQQRIGLQILDEDLSPPSLPLIHSGRASQLVGFQSFGKNEGDVVNAVADGRIGVAIVWGPVAGYFARASRVPLTVTPVSRNYSFSGIPFTYSIGMGVHRHDSALLQQLNQSIRKLQPRINQILASFAIPTGDGPKEEQ